MQDEEGRGDLSGAGRDSFPGSKINTHTDKSFQAAAAKTKTLLLTGR